MPFSRCLPLALLLLPTLTSVAQADAGDTFNVSPAWGGQHDSNLFRQPANRQSDTIQSLSLTLALNKVLAQQRFSLAATLIDYRYAKNDDLDYRAKNYNGAWNWALTHRLSGVLSANQTEVQNSFVDYSPAMPQNRRNIRKSNIDHLAVEWKAMGGWRLLGGLTHEEQSNSELFLAQNGFSMNTREVGVKYIWPAGNYLQLLRREGDGEYRNRLLVGFEAVPAPVNPQYDNAFRQNDTELLLSVPLTGKSSITAKLARQSREHEHFPDRDYSATTGRLDYSWLASGKISLSAGLRREVAAYQDFASSYYLSDGIYLQPAWQISAKVLMRLSYDWQQRKFDGALVPGLPERKDRLQTVRLGIDWFPVNWAALSTSYQRDSRDSSQDGFDFSADIVSLNARFEF